MLCRFCFSHRNFGCFDLVCLIVPSTFVIFPIGITVICNIICLWMGNLYAATPGQNPGVARIYIYTYTYIYICILMVQDIRSRCHKFVPVTHKGGVITSHRHHPRGPVPPLGMILRWDTTWVVEDATWRYLGPKKSTGYRFLDPKKWINMACFDKHGLKHPKFSLRHWRTQTTARNQSFWQRCMVDVIDHVLQITG